MNNKLWKLKALILGIVLAAPVLFGAGKKEGNLEVIVNVKAGKLPMPKDGVTGVDLLIYKKGENYLLTHETINKKNDGRALEFPFAIPNPYAGLTAKDELTMNVYGTIFNGDVPKMVGLKKQKIENNGKKITVDLNLTPVSR